MMNLKRISLFVELGVVALFVSMLSGCFGDGGTPNYDGAWTAGFANTAFVPPAPISSATVTCGISGVLPTITLANGVGSATQVNRCDHITGAGIIATQGYYYLISVSINTTTGAVNALVNGSPLTGSCISAVGCYAQNGTSSLSLTR